MFARAIGDPNPAYYGGADLVTERSRVIAPPTFVEGSIHYDRAFPYRPRIGEQWFGSAADSSSGPAPEPAAGPDEAGGTSFHAGTNLEYFGLLHPGDILVVSERQGSTWEKQGSRGGRLWFGSYVREFLRDGVPAVRSTTVVVSTQAKIDPAGGSVSPNEASARSATRLPQGAAPVYPIPAVVPTDISVGDTREQVLVENLTRAQILMYAGASGDFSPQHTDEIWNTKVAGYPSTFAHGMLTMGMTGRVLTDWFGNAALRAFSMRFSRQVWPGDTLIGRAEVTAFRQKGDRTEAELKLETTNSSGQVVATGSARVELAA
jgi:acyl dehydratase